jgi:hypothetical protein
VFLFIIWGTPKVICGCADKIFIEFSLWLTQPRHYIFTMVGQFVLPPLLQCLEKTDILMQFVPVTGKPCPEPDTKVNLTYNFISWMPKSCYGGYIQGALVSYSCTENPNLEPHKTLQCGNEGSWRETDITPWPTCKKPAEITVQPDGDYGDSGKVSFKILHLIRDYNGQVF